MPKFLLLNGQVLWVRVNVQKVIGKVFLDDVALVATANDEVIAAMVGISLHDVPQDGLAANFAMGLGRVAVCSEIRVPRPRIKG
jgi:hypothetical protein